LLKGTGKVPHRGGVRLKIGARPYEILKRWVAEGCQDSESSALSILEVSPERQKLAANHPVLQLQVHAHFKDEDVRDTTSLAVFSVNDEDAASVSPGGLVRFKHTAEATVLVRYLDQFASARLTWVKPDAKFTFKAPKPANYIDERVFARQRELQLLPAEVASDEVFLRRGGFDVIGGLPSPGEAPGVFFF